MNLIADFIENLFVRIPMIVSRFVVTVSKRWIVVVWGVIVLLACAVILLLLKSGWLDGNLRHSRSSNEIWKAAFAFYAGYFCLTQPFFIIFFR